MDENGRQRTIERKENGQEVAKQNGQAAHTRFHVDYWKERLYRKTFTRNGRRHEVSEWSVRLQHLGQRESFALGSVNVSVAATKAKEIATFLEANGWKPTLAKFKPSPFAKADVCTVGEFLADVEARSHLKALTVRRYAVKLRKIVVDVAKLEAGIKGKAKRAKYDYLKGGRKAWLAKVDGQRLDVLTPETVNAWRNRYTAKAGTDPVKRKSAERSAASCLRCARALFAPDVTAMLRVRIASQSVCGCEAQRSGSTALSLQHQPPVASGVCAKRFERQTIPRISSTQPLPVGRTAEERGRSPNMEADRLPGQANSRPAHRTF